MERLFGYPKDASALSDLIPISICSTASKILEKIIRDKLCYWFSRHDVIPKEQHGFVSAASTETLLSDSLYDWLTAINDGRSVEIIFFDLSKAFDKVPHTKLLRKLEYFGIRGQLLKWLSSYLRDRHMTVKVGNSYSDRHSCTSGVPQGGVLSPLLFLAYTADVPKTLKVHPNLEVKMFADDIRIYYAYQPCDQKLANDYISESVRKMMEWSDKWEIPVNLSKTVHLHLGPPPIPRYSFNNFVLRQDECVRDLDIWLTLP